MQLEDAKVRSDILKALAHPIRIVLISALSRADKSVGDLNTLVKVDQSTVSRHLAQLKKVGIVSERRDGNRIIHHLACPCILNAVDCTLGVLKTEARRRNKLLGRAGR
jgi:ArsR family transcriptional regulator, arsenate/arsenite/antimonite-responsive transcriptional repressor